MPPRLRTPLLGAILGVTLLFIHACDTVACGCTPPYPGVIGQWRGVSVALDTVTLDLTQTGTSIGGTGVVRRPAGSGPGTRLDLAVSGTAPRYGPAPIRIVATGWYDAPVEMVGEEWQTHAGRMLVLRYRLAAEPDSQLIQLLRQ